MSHATQPQADPTVDVRLRTSTSRALGARGIASIFLGVMASLSLVRVVTGADDLTIGRHGRRSGGVVRADRDGRARWPVGERAGVVNIGLEGMLVLGTFGAGWAGYQWGPWAGLFFGVTFGALGGLLHAVATVTFAVDQIVSGVAINILALGITQYLASVLFAGVEGGGPTQSPAMEPTGTSRSQGYRPS